MVDDHLGYEVMHARGVGFKGDDSDGSAAFFEEFRSI
jgi:hypothetical protein